MRTALIFLAITGTPLQAGETVSFTRDVVPALTRAGCNSGACHGSFQGRGGFRLSLLGFDPVADHDAITREARGRRIFAAQPEHSLLLRKPSGAIAHGGGKRLPLDSAGQRVLLNWLRQGAPAPQSSDPVLQRLEVAPAELLLAAGKQHPLTVRAHWSDGRSFDVAGWALHESNKDNVATVNESGLVLAHAPGRTAIMVRFAGKVAAVSVTVPFAAALDKAAPRHNFIDDHLNAAWRQVGIEPAPLCDDAAFLRRVHLDLTGTLPTVDEARRFLDDADPHKHKKRIDELLERPEYVDHWTLKWGDLLRAHRRALGEKGLNSFNSWLRAGLRENRGFDRLARELITARGNLYKTGPAAFYFIDKEPQELAETTAQVFLGVRLACAKCHHHPFEVWTQDDYHGLAAFFTRVQRKDTRDDGLYGGAQSINLGPPVNYLHPVTAQPLLPRVLGGPPLQVTAEQDARQQLADWIVSDKNPYFARSIVNRYWGHLFGRGLVDPIDDLRLSNPPTHPLLFDELTKEFTKSGFDLKHLLRTLCSSRTYQLAAEVAPKRDRDGAFFTHRKPRRLGAEVLLDAINQACETSEDFVGLPSGTRAQALPDPMVASSFLETFGRPKRITNCECERPSGSDLAQVLHLANGEKLHLKVTAAKGRVARLLAEKKSDEAIVEELYLATLCRRPTRDEADKVKKLLATVPRKDGLEDLLWTLLNLSEFTSNH